MWGQMAMEGGEGGWGRVRKGWGDSLHDFFGNHRTEGTSPRLAQEGCPTRLYRHALAISPIKAEGNQCGWEENGLGTFRKLWMIRGFIDRHGGCSRLVVSHAATSKLRRSLESVGKCSETKRATQNRVFMKLFKNQAIPTYSGYSFLSMFMSVCIV